jgi:hypothetical protein
VPDKRIEVLEERGINAAVGDDERSPERQDKCVLTVNHHLQCPYKNTLHGALDCILP